VSAPTVNESVIEKIKSGRNITNERRMKRQYRMSIHYRNPYQQGVSTANERRKEESFLRHHDICRFSHPIFTTGFFSFHFAMKLIPLRVKTKMTLPRK
jgi:hypothetical protein